MNDVKDISLGCDVTYGKEFKFLKDIEGSVYTMNITITDRDSIIDLEEELEDMWGAFMMQLQDWIVSQPLDSSIAHQALSFAIVQMHLFIMHDRLDKRWNDFNTRTFVLDTEV